MRGFEKNIIEISSHNFFTELKNHYLPKIKNYGKKLIDTSRGKINNLKLNQVKDIKKLHL